MAAIAKGRPRKNPERERKSFLWHPGEETAKAVEALCSQCDLSANAVITLLAEYGLQHVKLQPRTVQDVNFAE